MMRTSIQLFLMLIVTAFFSCDKANDTDQDFEKGSLSVSKEEFVVEAAGGEEYVTVKADKAVTFVTSKAWCYVEYSGEQADNNLKITVEENTTNNDRTAGVLVQVASGPLAEITVRQKGKSSVPDVEEEGIHVKAASYNIRYAAAADETTGNGWNVRKTPLANLIRNHDFDIVGTQEGNFSQMGDLMTLLPGYDYIGYPYGGSTSKNHTASIVYKKAEYEVVDQGVFWYSETPDVESIGWDATDTRICTWARMKHKASGQQFYFFASHFYYQYVTAKRNSGAVLVQKIQEIVTDNLPVISTGDYNSNPSTPQVLDILTLLQDSYDITETPRSGPVGTGFPGGVFEGTPGSRIDYVFVNNKVRVLTYAVLTDSYNGGRYPSDHLPVSCDLFLKK